MRLDSTLVPKTGPPDGLEEKTRMDYIKVAKLSEITEGKVKSYSLVGRRVALFYSREGELKAVEASCKHQGADLTKGTITDNVAICPRHQWEYDLDTGKCLNHDSLPLKQYGVKVEGEDVMVSMLPMQE